MKHETYIKSLARYIRIESESLQKYAERRQAEEKDLQKASFIEAMTNIVFNLGGSRFYMDNARRISETAEYLNAPKSFVECQPRGMTAFQIGVAWTQQQKKARGEKC